jgi:hypothetical protein
MSTVRQFGRKPLPSSISANPARSFQQPSRPFAPSPLLEQTPSTAPQPLNHASRPGYSLDRIAISSPSIQRRHQQQANQSSSSLQENNQLQSRIFAARTNGHPLDKGVQGQLERGLGADLSRVRIHADHEADALSRSVEALAFTTGPDIFFRAGRYQPGSSHGFHLLAHEAAHVVQQATGSLAGMPYARGISVSDPNDRFEQAAEASAARIAAGQQEGNGLALTEPKQGSGVSAPIILQRYKQSWVDYSKQTKAELAIKKRGSQSNKDANYNAASLEYTEAGKTQMYADLSKSGLGLHSEEALLLKAVGSTTISSDKEDMNEVAKRFAALNRGDAALYTERQPCQGKCKGLLQIALPRDSDQVFYSVPLSKQAYPEATNPQLYAKKPRLDVAQLKFLIQQQKQESMKGLQTLESLIKKPGEKIEQKEQKQQEIAKQQQKEKEGKKEIIDLT